MISSSSLFRISLCCTLFLLVITKSYATTIVWNGNSGTSWHTSINWIGNVVPTASDSVLITGGSNALHVNVLISDGAEALHVTVDDYSILSIYDTLTVAGVQGNAIKVEEEGEFLNYGILNISQSTVALYNIGHFENEGQVLIESCSNGIFNYDDGDIENNGLISIHSISRFGIENFASITNHGTFKLESIGDVNATAIYNNSLNGDVGYFDNQSVVFIKNVNGYAIVNWNLTTFKNSGTIWAEEIHGVGFAARYGSTFMVTASATIVFKSIGESPLEIMDDGIFDVAEGAFVNIID